MKLSLISTLVLFSLFVSFNGTSSESSEILYRSESESPNVVLYRLKEKTENLRLEIPSKWPLFPAHKIDFLLSSDSDLERIESELVLALKEHHLFETHGPKLVEVVRSLRAQEIKNIQCQQVHVEFVNPAAESGLDILLEKLSVDSGLFRQPSSFSDSVLLTQLEIEGQDLKLFVNFSESDELVGITVGTESGDFVDFSVKQIENSFVLYDRDENLVLSLATQKSNIRENILSFDLYIPKKHQSIIDLSTRRLNLYKVERRWVTDVEAVPQESDLAKVLGLADLIRELSETDLSLLSGAHAECQYLQAQKSLAQSGSGMKIRCDRESILYGTYLKLHHHDVISDIFKSCLKREDLLNDHKIDENHHYIRFSSTLAMLSDQDFSQKLQSCERASTDSLELASSLIEAERELAGFELNYAKGEILLAAQETCSSESYNELQCQEELKKRLAYQLLKDTSNNDCDAIDCFKQNFLSLVSDGGSVFPLDLVSGHTSVDLRTLSSDTVLIRDNCLNNRVERAETEWDLISNFDNIQRGCDEYALVETTRGILSAKVKQSIDTFISDQHLSRSVLEQVRHVYDVNRSFDGLARSFDELHQRALEQAVLFYQAHELNRQFPIQGDESENNENAREALRANMANDLGLEGEVLLEDLVYQGLTLRKRESAQQRSFPKNIYREYLAHFHLQMNLVKLDGVVPSINSNDETNLSNQREELTNCFKNIDRVADDVQYFNEQINECENQNESYIYLTNLQKDLEVMVSERLPLTESVGNQILTSLFDVRVCIENRPIVFSDPQRHARHLKICALMGKTDVALNLVNQLFSHHGKILGAPDNMPDRVARACVIDSVKLFVENTNNERLNSLLNDQEYQPFDLENSRPLLDFFVEQAEASPRSKILPVHLGTAGSDSLYTQSDRMRLSKFFEILSESTVSLEDFNTDIDTCLTDAQSAITASLRDRLITTSPGVWGDVYRSENETYEQVLRGVVDHELIDLVLQLQRRHEQFRLNLFNDPREEVLTRELTMETLADSIGVISHKLARGFVFDPQRMKTELIVFREELKEALKWVNATDTTVRFGELGEFFKDSQLADHLALSEISEQVYDRFNSFLQRMENDEIALFNRRTGKPENRLNAAEREERQQIFQKYSDLRILAREMTSSYDFRRIVHQGNQRGRDLLDLMKTHSVLPQILGREVSPTARQEIDRKIAELILDDRSPGGFADRFVAIVAQRELDLREENHWSLTKALFYNDSDFDWSDLKNNPSGQSALEFYSRQILLPRMLGHPVTNYEHELKMAEFRRYVSQAISEN